MRFDNLAAWLEWQERLHPTEIELGLERLVTVLGQMGLAQPPCPVVTVAGTNGKGSSVALLDAMLRAAGYRVGSYTSPHLYRYNERVRIDGEPVTDQALCDAFAHVDTARGDISLTYFEFGTLAAFDIFAASAVEVIILEVGMGGRLDAVNAWDPDVALVTALDIDHAAWLGNDRESIGREKAGIFRAGRPAVIGDPSPPVSVFSEAERVGATPYRLGFEYGYEKNGDRWRWWGPESVWDGLPLPALRGDFQLRNAAGVAMALHGLVLQRPITQTAFEQALRSVQVAGRFEIRPGPVVEIFDVAHNPQAAAALAANLQGLPGSGRTLAVFAALADKDLEGILRPLERVVDAWWVGGLDVGRGTGPEAALEALGRKGIEAEGHPTVIAALSAARAAARPGDRIVVFGSFYTVAEASRRSV